MDLIMDLLGETVRQAHPDIQLASTAGGDHDTSQGHAVFWAQTVPPTRLVVELETPTHTKELGAPFVDESLIVSELGTTDRR